MQQNILFVIPVILLVAVHYSVTNNPYWQLAIVGVSFALIMAAWSRLAVSKYSMPGKVMLGLPLLLAFFVLDGIYLVSSVFTANGITEQSAAHLNWGSLKSGGNSELTPYHYAVAAIFTILVITWLLISKSKWIASSQSRLYGFLIFATLSLAAHPGTADLGKIWWYSLQGRDMDVTIVGALEKGYIEKRAIQNTRQQRSNVQNKNVVLIYLESFEKTYLDQNIFPNLASNLARLDASENTYGKFKPSFFAQHTIAGLVSSLCGVPFAATGGSTGNVINNGAGSYYMPHVQCLGDVTKELGYHNVFYQGGDLNFTQKGAFFKSHGYDEVKGIQELWSDAPKNKRTNWGLHDDVLFDFARKRIDELASAELKQPFFFTLLTLDTHDPFGDNKTSKSCNVSGRSVYSESKDHIIQNQVHCSDFLIGEFVGDLQARYGDSIDIYLVADHLAHAHSQGHALRTKQERDLVFVSLNGPKMHKGDRTFTHLDIAPTILDRTTAGFLSKIGLGVSVLRKQATLLEQFGRKQFDTLIRENLTALAQRYWEYPPLAESPFVYDEELFELSFAGTSFPSPILFRLDDNNKIASYHSSSIDRYLKVSTGVGRILSIQKCGALNKYQANNHPKSSFCIMVGNLGSATLHVEPIESGRKYNLSDFSNYLNQHSNTALLRSRLFEGTSNPTNIVKSAGSVQIAPLAETQFFTGKDSSQRMVTNYWDLSLYEKFKGFKNHSAASQSGLYFFKIDSGQVELLNIWRDCNELKDGDLKSVIQNSGASEFVLMSGKSGIDCSDHKSNTPFDAQISTLQRGHSLIAYLDLKSNHYKYISDQSGQNIQLNLINDNVYSHYPD